jgi:P4 family phage/plasmid primase-like protien
MPSIVPIASGTRYAQNILQQFLRTHSTSSKDEYTHISIAGVEDGKRICSGGKYVIDMTNDQFTTIYTKEVFENKGSAFLAERINDQEVTPIKIDIDLRYLVDPTDDLHPPRIYTKADIKKICMIVMKTLETYIEVDDLHEADREVFVMEKRHPAFVKDKNGANKKNDNNKLYAKDGIHLVFPRIATYAFIQHIIRVSLIQQGKEIFEPMSLINSLEETIDEAVIETNPWQVYGSRKPGSIAYEITDIWQAWSDKVVPSDNEYTPFQLVKLLSMRNKTLWPEIKQARQSMVLNHVNQGKKEKELKLRMTNTRASTERIKTLTESELEFVEKLMDCLDVSRAKEYMKWLQLGWCLYNIHNKDDRVLNMWIKFSKKAPEYSDVADEVCRERWSHMRESAYSMGSLKYWANSDNPVEYKKLVMTNIKSHLIRICKRGKKINEYVVSEILYMLFKDEYMVYVNQANANTCYKYDYTRHRWVLDEKAHQFTTQYISNTVMTMCCDLRKDYYKSLYEFKMRENPNTVEEEDDESSGDNTDEVKALEKKIENFNDVIDKLQSKDFKNAIVYTSEKEFFCRKGHELVPKLDSNDYMIAFSNGVYDLLNEEFRDGRPEDMNTMNTNIPYVEYDENHPIIQEIYEFFEQVFIIKSVRRYMLKLLASYLDGDTESALFSIFSGKGGNGKSKMITLIQKAMGFHSSPQTSYVGKMNISVFTEKRASSTSPTAEIAKCKGKRFCSMEEPDKNDILNIGLMKEMTGGDIISARALYRDPMDFKPQFKLALICNDKPEIKSNDGGTWRRIRNTEFLSTFTDSPKPENIFHFKRCNLNDARLNEWAPYFMAVLIHWYKILVKEGLKSDESWPDEIREYTQDYRSSNDQFNLFMESIWEPNITYEDERELPLYSVEVLYRTIYLEWFCKENSIPVKERMKRPVFKSYLDEKLCLNIAKAKWPKIRNYRIPMKSEFAEHGSLEGDIFDTTSIHSMASNASKRCRDDLDG